MQLLGDFLDAWKRQERDCSELTHVHADRLARESCIQKFPVHKQMEEVWPSEHECPGFK